MGCTPSVTATSATASEPRDAPNGDEKVSRTSVSDGPVKNGSSGDLFEGVNKTHFPRHFSGSPSQPSDKVNECPAGDDDSESEGASFLCANLRRNFMPGRSSGSGLRSSSSGSGCRRRASSTCGAAVAKLTLPATEEQNENLLSSEDGGDSNPLLKCSANPQATATASGQADGCSVHFGQTSFAGHSTTGHLPNYAQLQTQYHQPLRLVGEKVN